MPETPTPTPTSTLIEELLAALLEAVDAESAEPVEIPEPVAVIPFPTVL